MKKHFNAMKKKSLYPKEVITVPESLKKLVGKEIIRIGPTVNGDWTYTDYPVLFKGFSSDNKMIVQYMKKYISFLGEKIDEIPICFTDDKWILLEDAFKAEDNELNKLIGKKIKRIRPVLFFSSRESSFERYTEDCSYMCEYGENPPILVSASQYHIILKIYNYMGNERNVIVGPRYSNPEDWVEVKQ